MLVNKKEKYSILGETFLIKNETNKGYFLFVYSFKSEVVFSRNRTSTGYTLFFSRKQRSMGFKNIISFEI